MNNISNLGSEINVEYGYFTIGLPIVSYEKFTGKFNLITQTIVPENDITIGSLYPLSGVNYNWGWGLVIEKDQDYTEIKDLYKFYEFVPNSEQQQFFDGLIDYNDILTTITPSNSSVDEWYKEGGIADRILYSSLKSLLNNINE